MKSIRTILFTLSLLLITTAGIPYGHVTASSAPASGKVYQIGTDVTFAPFEFQDASGEFVGIDMDLLAAIAEDQNFRYEIKPMGFNAAVQALEANQVDGVIAGMSITEERKQKFDFSDPYFQSGVVMAIRENDDSIQGYEDLRGKRVAVKTGTEVIASLSPLPMSMALRSCPSMIRTKCTMTSEQEIPLLASMIIPYWHMECNRTTDYRS